MGRDSMRMNMKEHIGAYLEDPVLFSVFIAMAEYGFP
jgi:hypothetical protein